MLVMKAIPIGPRFPSANINNAMMQQESRSTKGNGERAWYDRVLGTKKPSRRWKEAIDDVVDGVDYGESPLPIERNDTWFGSIFGPGLHNFRKFCQMPFVRFLHWPFLLAVDLSWYTLRGLAKAASGFNARLKDVSQLAEHTERLRRVREISMSEPDRLKRAVTDPAVFGAPPGNEMLRQVAALSGMHENGDLDKPDVYREFVGVALAKPQFVALLYTALQKEQGERRTR